MTAFLLTSTDRHLVIRSCVLFLLRRQSSANCRGVSSSERHSIQWEKRSATCSVRHPQCKISNSGSTHLQIIMQTYIVGTPGISFKCFFMNSLFSSLRLSYQQIMNMTMTMYILIHLGHRHLMETELDQLDCYLSLMTCLKCN